MPHYRDLLKQIDNLEHSLALVAPTTEAATKFALLLDVVRAEANAHPIGISYALCAQGRARAAEARYLIECSQGILRATQSLVSKRRGRA